MRIATGCRRRSGSQGDEAIGGSFSRFVQPFAYSPVACSQESTGGYRYEEIQKIPDPPEREAYFTVETADALFRRALWVRLKPCESPWGWRYPLVLGGREIQVCMHAPELILFEWRRGLRAGSKEKSEDRDLLRIGLLQVELCFPDSLDDPEEDRARPDLAALLQLNELFRYWQRPYEKHGEKMKDLLRHCPISILQPKLIGTLGDSREIARKAYFERRGRVSPKLYGRKQKQNFYEPGGSRKDN
ncbi:MAG: hypothetical protein V3T83_08190 [Acidobacteriota bacterium]